MEKVKKHSKDKKASYEDNDIKGVEYAKELAEAEHGLQGEAAGITANLTMLVAITWSLFQLSIASWLLIDTVFIRAIHLAFGMFLIFLNIPMFKFTPTWRPDLRFFLAMHRVTILDYILGILAVITALYIFIDYDGIATRYGQPTTRDIVMGLMLVVLLLEATRRVIGPALPLIALMFVGYSFVSEMDFMPEVLLQKAVSLNRFVGQITMSTEGIYGIPLDVSATIVFLFVLFGTMLEKAGAGNFFIRLALCLLGGFKGGPAKAAILGSGLTGMVSGSSIANIVTTGTFTIPLMKKVGYPATKAGAIEVAASTDGQLAPPIMGAAAFIIAEYVNVPYIEVVKAAAIPAFVSYAALLYISHIEASKLGLEGIPRKELPKFFPTLISGLHFMLPLGMLLWELIVTRHSPELAAFRAIMVLVVIMLVQHPILAISKGKKNGDTRIDLKSLKDPFILGCKELINSLAEGARNMAGVAMATAAAGIIVGIVAMGLGGLITQVIDVLSGGNIFLMLAITAFASLLIGMGLPTTATYIVMASLTAPAIVSLGGLHNFIVPLMAAHLFCFYFGILADDTPPVGLAAYAAAAIAEADPIRTGLQGFMYDIRTAILPFMFIFNTELILHGVNSWAQGLLIFGMACIGNFAFASATQGWFITRNRIWEFPLLLCVTYIMMQPQYVAEFIGLPHDLRYLSYLIGLTLWGLIWLMQRPRAAQDKLTTAQNKLVAQSA
ncbi:TRAP transporter permease [Desulfovibrio ferrophilus]|uniref:TRAP-type transporter, 4TM/12TM fusion protein permease n=1 Tax=Desulfovibrio ferrophilus TaxID=241368 RepID=A0A2Z6AY01_9BACT|nr:TRAP transporter permease [Desulfovibrio ferrophilus]BBD08142.1 TRAP-type transporter, 4TM/12TM fusion protein permease [Desulfovibrio ferrophilus]